MCFSQQQQQGGPKKNKAKRCGGGGGRGEEGGASSRGNSVGYRQILSQLVEVKGLQSIAKNCYYNFGRSNTAKVGGEGVRRSGPKSSNKHKQQQTAAATSRNRNTSNKKSRNQQQNQEQQIRSSTNNNPEKVRERCGSRRWGERRPVEFWLCSRLFFSG